MDDVKQRNREHIKNKRKYKPKSVKDPKYIPHKSTVNLGSNWDRYESEKDNQEFQLTSNTDFSILASAPITKGHHFQFKSDKLIAEEIESETTELFSLNVNMLRDSILTVPFYERVGVDSQYFTENQLKFMNRDAEVNLAKYNEKYDKKLDEKVMEKLLINSSSDEKDEQYVVDNDNSPVREDLSNILETSDEVLTVTQETQEKVDEELEQWLDDILDD